ncbi:transcriptional repressor [Bifidobacterium sp. ESL0682]|uniref:Fur family transcriptional regulator n=1 Tax=Bifidobacterium sp. ESL0682 TaxID=2983212 RepID=UPI0023F87241|nr:transcriptional repressor [Bifidobacterium sp. ESL0682]WEV41474.1 transcriptional repressor [Bifidobacterium sp. ESL0682]
MRRVLTRHGRRGSQHTWQKDAVLKALSGCDDFISAQDLYRILSENGQGIGLSTVYRQLNALADDGRADTIHLNDQQMFRICDDGEHHHHLVCENCGKTVEIEPPEEWVRKVAVEHGFTVSSHTLEVFGLCPDCQRLEAETETRNKSDL